MSEPFVGEIRMFGGNFAPVGWMFCEGQLLPVSSYDALFSLLGTTYGGDGRLTFALPDLRGRLPVHQGTGFLLGQAGGAEVVTLTVNQIPSHTHALLGSRSAANDANPGGNVFGETSTFDGYNSGAPTTAMASESITATGGSQSHENMQPYLCVSYIISLFGIYPSQF